MAHKKAGGTAQNQRDSNPQYLGVKLYAGEKAAPGAVILRQRGTVYLAGSNTDYGKDHTIFATKAGVVAFKNRRKTNFTGKTVVRKEVEVR